ncbi:MAG: hypothetical protein ACLSAJ_12400 [Intestinibacter bartlettii]|uniref:hypothetical protein n=1 Tax=Intestinibacter bartlettii TaxID=261299 RepID=UPI00399F7EDF
MIKFDHKKNKVRYWMCKCQCGNTHIASTSNLTGEITRSCGCLKKDYNKSRNITIKDKGSKKKKIRQAEKVVLKEDYKSEKKYGEVKEGRYKNGYTRENCHSREYHNWRSIRISKPVCTSKIFFRVIRYRKF